MLQGLWNRVQEKKIRYGLLLLSGIALIWYTFFALPDQLFKDPYSTIVEDNQQQLLSAAIAQDGQWRFPVEPDLPEKFKESIVAFEDKRFWSHPGIDFLALMRATRQNIASGKIISGGSTISMQVIRLAGKNRSRNLLVKFYEMVLATRLELRFSKDEILSLYTAHAPFGGNVVGLGAACARYFGNSSAQLSWAEAAMLAVLPNDPALIHPAKNRDQLLAKRNRLLTKLYQQNKIDSLTYSLATEEPLPMEPLPFPSLAPHLLSQALKDGFAQKRVQSTLDRNFQKKANDVLKNHSSRLFANHVYNGAILIAEVKTGNVLAYVGNIKSSRENQDQVNVITAPRSTGSILKPFLFAALLDEGKILPGTLVPDVPLELAGFAPKNFSMQFDGAVPANVALIRSLNIPAVFELRDLRHEKFHTLLKQLGMTSLNPSPNRYGLTLILGGAEGTLWDVTGMYASMGRILVNYFDRPGSGKYSPADIHPLHYVTSKSSAAALQNTSLLGAGSIWATVETLKELYRPGEESGWKYFGSSKNIAWKTGTSLGHRDAWAIGLTPDYVVGIWVGNADGEGRPRLTGTEAAAPLLFDVFSFLPGQSWFQKPNSELAAASICSSSGMRASSYCEKVDTLLIPVSGLKTLGCSYHRIVPLTQDRKFRVNSNCEMPQNIAPSRWFVLPPVQEYYFRLKNSTYKTLPPFRKDCVNPQGLSSLEIIYPKADSRIYVPIELDGAPGKVVFEATHRQTSGTIFWHLNGQYLGSTRLSHQMALTLGAGQHTLSLVDESGELLERNFTVIARQ
jgi:penicillin-binding protein 1C